MRNTQSLFPAKKRGPRYNGGLKQFNLQSKLVRMHTSMRHRTTGSSSTLTIELSNANDPFRGDSTRHAQTHAEAIQCGYDQVTVNKGVLEVLILPKLENAASAGTWIGYQFYTSGPTGMQVVTTPTSMDAMLDIRANRNNPMAGCKLIFLPAKNVHMGPHKLRIPFDLSAIYNYERKHFTNLVETDTANGEVMSLVQKTRHPLADVDYQVQAPYQHFYLRLWYRDEEATSFVPNNSFVMYLDMYQDVRMSGTADRDRINTAGLDND